MKGLNIKRIVALGIGAALIGSALAPVVSAATSFNNLGDMTNDQLRAAVVSDAGVPVVDVVVGANAAISDVVWAGNIAARVAQLATTPATGTGSGTITDATVDVTVGGTTVVSGGARELSNTVMNSSASSVEYAENIGNTYFKSFANDTLNASKDGNTTFSVSINEKIGVSLDAKMNITNTKVKDLTADIDQSDLNYVMTATGLSLGALPYSDDGTEDYVPVYFLGKKYVVDSIDSTGTDVVLVSENAEQLYSAGDSISEVKGRDGKVYSLKFVSGLQASGSSAGTNYVARVALINAAGTTEQEQTFNANSDIIFRDAQGKEILDTKVRLKTVYSNGSTTDITYSFSVLVGNDRVEIKNGREVPYDPNSTGTVKPWVATVAGTTSSLTITLKNNNFYRNGDTPLYSATQSFYPTGKTTSIDLFQDTNLSSIGKVKFNGFYEAGVQKSSVAFKKGSNVASGTSATSYGAIEYIDSSGQTHSIPMALFLPSSADQTSGQSFTFEGINHAYGTNSSTSPTAFAYKANSTDGNLLNTPDKNVLVNGLDVNSNVFVTLTGKNSQTYNYVAMVGETNGIYLTLAGADANTASPMSGIGTTGLIASTQYNAASILFLGTSLNDVSGVSATPSDFNSTLGKTTALDANKPYYYPDLYDFNGEQSGSSTQTYRTAVFMVTEGTAASVSDANGVPGTSVVFIDTEGGNVGTVETANIAKLGYTGRTTAVSYTGYNLSLTNFSEYLGLPGESSSNYIKAYTDRGSKIMLDSRELSFVIPDQNMKAYFTVESNDVTVSNTGGTVFTGVADGASETKDGVTITVDAINGTASGIAGGVEVVKAGNLVKVAGSFNGGKHIIVGGFNANTAAVNLQVSEGNTLENMLVNSGDYVAAVLSSGDIVAAGYTGVDTGTAASALITALEGLM